MKYESNPVHIAFFFIVLILLGLSIFEFGSNESIKTKKSKIRVATTTGMITDIVKNVGRDRIDVIGLMGPGVDPHLYKATEGDVEILYKADVIFYSGLHLEAKIAEIFEQMEKRKKTVTVTKSIPKMQLLDFLGYPGQYDPHVWFDVRMWINATQVVRDALSEADPDNKEYYRANAKEYIDQLDDLDDYVRQQAESIPKQQRVLVTAHDAFSYFGRAYGFEVKGLQGVSTAAEAGIADVSGLSDFIAKRKIKAIFVESSVPERNIKAVQEAVRAKGWNVEVGGSLYSDAMGNFGTVDGTYIGMVKHNIDTISDALR